MAEPGMPFDAEEEKRIQAAVEEYKKNKRDKEIQKEIESRIYALENNIPKTKKK